MTAIVVPVPGGRCGVSAPLGEWQTAGHFCNYPGGKDGRVTMACDDRDSATRLAFFVNQRVKAKADLAASRAYAERMEAAE